MAKSSTGERLYNLCFAVGDHSPNRPDDVCLIQWMLWRTYSDHPVFIPPENMDLRIDGYVGRHTLRWIKAFQRDIQRLGHFCPISGRVDPLGADQDAGRDSHTLLWLNAALRSANPRYYFDFGCDPVVPSMLMAALGRKT